MPFKKHNNISQILKQVHPYRSPPKRKSINTNRELDFIENIILKKTKIAELEDRFLIPNLPIEEKIRISREICLLSEVAIKSTLDKLTFSTRLEVSKTSVTRNRELLEEDIKLLEDHVSYLKANRIEDIKEHEHTIHDIKLLVRKLKELGY